MFIKLLCFPIQPRPDSSAHAFSRSGEVSTHIFHLQSGISRLIHLPIFFSFLDVSGNKALSNAEINRASKLLVFFSTINGQEFDEAGLFGIISSYAITPLITKVILNNFDFDNSAELTLEEILQDREGLFDLDFSENDQIEIDNQKINEQIRDFINKLQGLGSFL